MRVLGDIPRLNARRYPEKAALVMNKDQKTFRQLNSEVNLLANGLLSLGVKSGDKIAIMAQNCIEYPVIVYAAAKCGAILVPINFRYAKKELIYVVNDSKPRLLFYDPECASLIDEARSEFSSSIHLVSISGDPLADSIAQSSLIDNCSNAEPALGVDPESAAMIMYTSGTTGFPKGVLYSHAAYLGVYVGLAIEGDLSHHDKTMVALPLFHNGGLNALLQPTLMLGGTAFIIRKGFDPEMILDYIEHCGITLTLWVPTMLTMLIQHPKAKDFNLRTLDKIWYGSSSISPTVLKASQELFHAKFYQWYGQTETGMNSILSPEDHTKHPQYTGREIFNAEIRIVDENGQDTPRGEIGEIISAQKPLGMIGYHNLEDKTRETIQDGWIHTGDLARVEGEGYFTVVDRIKDMIISGAENIYPKEIEDVISSHPAVKEVAVIGIPDDVYGESVCAVVVPKLASELDPQKIIDHCAERLARYKKPKKVIFVEELPKNAAGKVTKNVLRTPFWADRESQV